MLPLKKAVVLGFFYWLSIRCIVLFSKVVLYSVATFSRRCSATSNFTSNICWLRFNHYILFLHILPRVSDHYIFLTFSRRYSYFFRNENMKNICENFTSNICWLRLKLIFFMKMNSNIFANFTPNICSLPLHFCIFYLEYLLITITFLHILPRISAHLGHKILNSRNSELRLQAYSSNPVENEI